MFHQVDTVFNATSSKPIPGAQVQVYDASGAIVALFADESGTPIESVSSIANTAVTDGDGVYDFWVADGTYDLRFFVGQSMVRAISKIALDGSATDAVTTKANASALGVSATDSNLGEFSGSTIPPDQTAKQALQALETAVEERAPLTDLASHATGKGAGLVGFSHDATYAPGTVGRSLQRSVYVTDPPFNAVADGATDDAPAFNAALTYLHSIGGGILYAPPGDYYLKSILRTGANTTLFCLPGVTFHKGHDATFLNNGLGYTTFSDIPAYGGHGNIEIHGGVWEGFSDEIYDGFTHLALGYGTNITVRNAIFKDGIGDGHMVDMASCDNVLFENCQFLGFSLNNGGADRADTIQLDHNAEGSFPYFGLPKFKQNKNITVRRCIFGPNPANADARFGSVYTGVGSHGSVQGQYAENIFIRDNVFTDAAYAGVRVWKWRNTHITGNTFIGGGGRGVHITATPAGSVSSQDINRVQTNQAEASEGILIDGNTFKDIGDIAIFGADITYGTDASIKHTDIKVTNNTFGNIFDDCVDMRDGRDLFVTGSNNMKLASGMVKTTRTQGITINEARGEGFSSTSAAIAIDASSSDFTIMGVKLKSCVARGILVAGSSDGVISGVRVTDHDLSGASWSAIQVQGASNDILITDPVIKKEASAATGADISVANTCSRVDVINGRSNTGNAPVLHQSPGGIASFKYPGSPEGLISASPGSECNDITNGVKYLKKSGSGNTGWKLVTQAA